MTTATPARHPHKDCHKCPVFFKCEQLPPCATHTSTPAPEPDITFAVNKAYNKGKADAAGIIVENMIIEFNKEHDAQVAKAERERVLDDLVYWMYDCPFGGREGSDRCHTILAHKIESLRHQQGNNNRMEQ